MSKSEPEGQIGAASAPSASVSAPSASVSASASQNPAHAWRIPLVALFALLVLLVTLYRDTAVAMVTIWYRSETFTHGFVVAPIALWLIWRRRHALVELTPKPNFYLLLVMAGLGLMWLLGDMVAVNSVTQLAFVAMLVACVPAILGLQLASAIAFPLGFMFFSVPIGEFIMPQLMDWTADYTILGLRLSGLPVYREGLYFVIPSGSWSVVEACSGVRYLIASLTVGALYAYLNYQSTSRRLLFVLVSILVPVVANWLRAYMIVMLGHYSGNTIAVGVDHLIYGWVFFGVVILLMFIIGARWSEPEVFTSAAKAVRASSPSEVPNLKILTSVVMIALLLSSPLFVKHAFESGADPATGKVVLDGQISAPWQLADAKNLGFHPSFDNPSTEVNRTYANGDAVVGVYLGYYRNQNYSRKLVSSSNALVRTNDRAWSQVKNSAITSNLGAAPHALRTAELRRMAATVPSAPERLLVWQIYWINGRLTSNDYLAKVYSAAYQLLGRGDDSAVIIVYAPMDRDGVAEASLQSFLSSQYGAIDAALRSVAANR